MIVSVRVKPNTKHHQSVVYTDGIYIVSTKAPAVEGRANIAVQKLLAEYFNVSKSNIRLVRGATMRVKTFEIIL